MAKAKKTKPQKEHDRWATFNYMHDAGFNRFVLTSTERLVWLAIFRHGDSYGIACIADSRIKEQTALSRPTIQATIEAMHKKKALKILFRKRGGTSRYKLYGIHKKKSPQGSENLNVK